MALPSEAISMDVLPRVDYDPSGWTQRQPLLRAGKQPARTQYISPFYHGSLCFCPACFCWHAPLPRPNAHMSPKRRARILISNRIFRSELCHIPSDWSGRSGGSGEEVRGPPIDRRQEDRPPRDLHLSDVCRRGRCTGFGGWSWAMCICRWGGLLAECRLNIVEGSQIG